jgi:hypothetical protein
LVLRGAQKTDLVIMAVGGPARPGKLVRTAS